MTRPRCERRGGPGGRHDRARGDDIQGNVLRGYNFPCARYLVARVRDDRAAPEAARRWLAAQADPVTTDAEWIRAAAPGRQPRALLRRPRRAGLPRGCSRASRATSARGWRPAPADRRRRRRRARALGGGPAPGRIHVLVTLSGDDPAALARTSARVRRDMAAHGLDPGFEQEAAKLGGDREHFGFTDGFGQPSIAGVVRHEIPGQGVAVRRRPWHRLRRDLVPSATDRRLAWRALRPGSSCSATTTRTAARRPRPPRRCTATASFMVWRKLRQDVAGFRALLAGGRRSHRLRRRACSPRRSSAAGPTAAR